MEIKQSNNSDFLKKEIVVNSKRNKIEIGNTSFFKFKIAKEYDFSEVKEFKEIDVANIEISSKSKTGSLGGALVGGVLLGGVGAVVGSVAGGNKTKHRTEATYGFSFTNGDWILFETEINPETMLGRVNKALIDRYFELFALKISNPFDA